MAHRTYFPEHRIAGATNLNGDILVHMPWCHFRYPVQTLQHQTGDGGMNLIDVAAKFSAVFLIQFLSQRNRSASLTAEWLHVWLGAFTAEWLHVWPFYLPRRNPPPVHRTVAPDLGLKTFLFSRIRVHRTPGVDRKKAVF
jgi:hypothetical protein